MLPSDPEGRHHHRQKASFSEPDPCNEESSSKSEDKKALQKAEFPGHWMDEESRDMFLSVFEMSCELNWAADNS